MEISSTYLEDIKKRESKHKFHWQQQAEEISKYFSKPLYWLFYKFSHEDIISTYRFMEEKNDKNVQSLIKRLQWLKNNVRTNS